MIEAARTGWSEGRHPVRLRGDGLPVRMSEAVAQKARMALEATVIRACRDCQAPGTFVHAPSILEGWPACYVESGDLREGAAVGDTCPNCGAARPDHEPLGEIWVRELH